MCLGGGGISLHSRGRRWLAVTARPIPLTVSYLRSRPCGWQVTKQGLTKDLKKGSWEEKMTAQCRSRLAVKPKKAMAALFYSQHPDGRHHVITYTPRIAILFVL